MDAEPANKPERTVVIADRFSERRSQFAARRGVEDAPIEALEPGDRLGHYLIMNRLGDGGMGIVYKAHDVELNRTVALKVLPPHLCSQGDLLQRFRTEAQVQAHLHSSYTVMLYSTMETRAGEVLVLEYLEGETLRDRIHAHGPLSPADAVGIFVQVLEAVDHIHSRGVIHHDLKPSNLFITRAGAIKIIDFGIAKTSNPEMSQGSAIVGTLLYMPPEQFNGRNTDARSDIYTLGVSLFEAVTGRLPFERQREYALMHAHVQERPPSPRDVQSRVPRALERIILRSIEKDPARRFQSVAEFRQALLKTGIAGTRDQNTSAKGAPDVQNHIETRHFNRRMIAGYGLDVALVCVLCALIYVLGLYPRQLPTESADAAAPAVAAVATSEGSEARAPSAPPRVTQIKRRFKPERSNPSSDPYEALRDAWGR